MINLTVLLDEGFGFSVVEVLRLGVIGLGFILAFLAYRLLSKESDRAEPKTPVLKAIYVFMLFSVVCLGIGLIAQFNQVAPATVSIEPKVVEAKDKIMKNLSEYKWAGFNTIREYVDRSYNDAFLCKVIVSYPDDFEIVALADTLDPIGIKLKLEGI